MRVLYIKPGNWACSLTFEKEMDATAKGEPHGNQHLTAAHGGPHPLDEAIRDKEDDRTSRSKD